MTLRIVSGRLKGIRLDMPKNARPSSSRLREGLLAMLRHNSALQGDYSVVMDLFAGSGAVGLEAVSNFAARGIFVENDRENLVSLQKNISICGKDGDDLQGIAKDVFHLQMRDISSSQAPQLIFADPPYRAPVIGLFHHLQQAGFLQNCRLLVIQTAPKTEISLQEIPPICRPLEHRRYGNASLHFFAITA